MTTPVIERDVQPLRKTKPIAIEVKGISKSYDGKKVLDDVSVGVEKGTITSFIGPNGAGKSTLISLMSRLTKKDTGQVLVDGKEIDSFQSRELAKKVSILKQANNINIRLTIRELVSFGRFPYSQNRLSKEDWLHVDDAIDYMSLREMQDKYLDQLSGGQRQRAYIAMVLAQDTDYIILDEPLNNLDMKHSVSIMKTLRNLVDKRGKTILLVVHDINFASCYSDNIVAMKDGRIVEEGACHDIINPQSLRTIYDMDIAIEEVNSNRICVYFT
ncbi:iron ABC transporter ATP-binding protein [Alkalicoccobacillus murimartini]|uniref:Iron complex transport system ATP-binding protein n=1 Tax=Alkalicoccobacillus murimartini TaxID=171685 RepID=A0ABT9YIX3_9BACI|nr:ATP-binding cassette domain-containing protein [Alkalicoccobacillus murimartini]MDQ0207553.1 iron complex transport system ATP-binding protein [Alkalicoccobacillus murimartini]